MKDKSGRTIRPGDFIVYGQSLGRSAGLNYARIIEVDEAKDNCRAIGTAFDWCTDQIKLQKPATLRYGGRILVVTPEQMDFDSYSILNTVIDY